MRKVIVFFTFILFSVSLMPISFAQTYTITGVIKDSLTDQPIIGARVKFQDTKLGAVANVSGLFVIKNVSAGEYEIKVSMPEYRSVSKMIQVSDSMQLVFYLEPLTIEAEEIVVSGTRTARSIADVPIRIEAIPQEEVEEKILMRPASVAMLLNETAGIHVQNTSGTSNSANIRIQGLDGRYTQILVDGIPSFSGLASGFGITQILPLNLRQVEIIKGANSALYGADAIAGLVNFITKEPRETPELSGILNLTSQQGYDASAYYGEKFDALGFTALLSYNHQKQFDVNGDNFSDLAGYSRFNFSPKVEYQFSETMLGTINAGYFSENRLGGVMNAPESEIGKAAPYLESNKTIRVNANASFGWTPDKNHNATLRAAATTLERNSFYGSTPFNASQTFLFADGFYSFPIGNHSLQTGTAFSGEDFTDKTPGILQSRSYMFRDFGAWIQDEVSINELWKLLASARVDNHNIYGTFVTPRASLLFKQSPSLTFRIGGGTGFKAPTIFLEDAELHGFRNVRPISNAKVEQAQSATFDMNYRTLIGDISAQFNFALYTTWLQNSLIVDADSLSNNIIFIRNVSGLTRTRGGELTSQFSSGDFKLSLSYAYLDTRQSDRGVMEQLELNPHHWLGIVLMYENKESGIKAGIENYYTSTQHLYDNPFRTMSPDFWLNGFMVEKTFGSAHLFFNAENIFDVRQTRFDPTFTGNPETGDFHPLHIYAPLEGRSFNGGIRFVLQ